MTVPENTDLYYRPDLTSGSGIARLLVGYWRTVVLRELPLHLDLTSGPVFTRAFLLLPKLFSRKRIVMVSSHGLSSAPTADTKGKGILYEEDDDPIQLIEDDDAHTIREYHMSLNGKILNPKKQTVEKLISTMPTQWGMQGKITANDLGNEDLQSVISQGPFHYNYCMFVLVRWEPIVHDEYPGLYPFGWRSQGYRCIFGQ